ncbi:LysR family transcriptional regulator [Flavipsychrobacter stenotrophus]|uniref:LysR family transcriptional regulator n=1 Tax=Flavipsychrobacter stenotrophus TaxID=2077091 RepID=A0A2S7SQF2_9BACT|nr:LysR substrate-binding domain-containing protein [Flavipsychrobacter stenotrophus]PQJ08984.1 LysR family transcriptional regulator [Flavipsychrobacter stenotrophus]
MLFDALTLECFIAVADTASFTSAAGKVARTQSAVSQQISKLESLVGKPLFLRGRHLSLTSEGEILLTYAKKIVQLNRDAMDRFKHPELQGEVRFGLPEDFASVFLSDVLTEYASLHPRIMLNVECDLTLNLFARFKKKEFDLVLVKMNKPEDFPNGMEVWSEALEWVGNSNITRFEDDDPVQLVLSPQPCVYRARAIHSLEKLNKKWRIVFSSHSYAGTIAAVKAGMGITVLPRNMVPDELKIIRANKYLPKLDDTHISLLKHNSTNYAVNSFEEFVVERLKP